MERITQMELLGCLITTDNKAAIQHRLVKAVGAFWKHKAFFLSSVVPWRQKMIEYVKKVRPVALYGSASWQWGADASAALTTWEGAMLRRMCRVGWRQVDGESFGDWRRRQRRPGNNSTRQGLKTSLQPCSDDNSGGSTATCIESQVIF